MDSTFNLRMHWPWLLVVSVILVVATALAPILTPFVFGAVFAYLGDPIADWLEEKGLNRTAAVALIFLAITAAIVLLIAIITPMLQDQLTTLIQGLPRALDWVQDTALPSMGINLPSKLKINGASIQKWVFTHWQEAGTAAGVVANSGMALLGTLANIALAPVVSFYLLRDWDHLVAWVDGIIPPRNRPLVRRLAGESDEVLGSFVRGQLLVMSFLSVYYALGLWIAGLKLALLVAIIAGLFSFVPYLGFGIGFGLAILASLMQEPSLTPLLWIVLIFVIGQALEGNVLTPLLVGEKIGLHPVTVIFSVMAGGQLFGFTGVLVALPMAAVIAVGVRELLRRWFASSLYQYGQSTSDNGVAPALPPPEPPVVEAEPT